MIGTASPLAADEHEEIPLHSDSEGDVETGTDNDGLIPHNGLQKSARLGSPETASEGSDDDASSSKAFEMEGGAGAACLNDEFAVPLSAAKTWAAEFKGESVCESVCLSVDDDDPTAGCNHLTACLCGACLKADRVGNMPVFWSRKRAGKPTELLCMLGPFWPCLLGVTYPLILGVSIFSAIFFLPACPAWAVAVWAVCTLTLLVSLGLTACTNPGIVRRHREAPPTNTVGWRWSDQAQTYRPPRSTFDRDCGLVIEEFDHTCPWTGTGIGKANMPYFSTFVGCVCICLVFNIMLMIGIFDPEAAYPHGTHSAAGP